MLTGETDSCYQVTQDAGRKVANALLKVTETTTVPVEYSITTKPLFTSCIYIYIYSKMLADESWLCDKIQIYANERR